MFVDLDRLGFHALKSDFVWMLMCLLSLLEMIAIW